ncbi:hypothetical protein EYF80_045672 [Liparis tanakae]|uniref:Secreted protein n=1 Tax=Liparis tanakae TaxID=230148 RepID=A0A4Z2FSY6_9TELE|nr:hypothetical protein EYF80_045672 [Liparis tanakae]
MVSSSRLVGTISSPLLLLNFLNSPMLCQVCTTSGRKDLTMYRCPGFRMSYSDQVQSTLSARRRPPPISSLLRNSILAQRPRWAQEDMLLLMVLGELSSSRYTVTGSPEGAQSAG